jgi:hypothetical protein
MFMGFALAIIVRFMVVCEKQIASRPPSVLKLCVVTEELFILQFTSTFFLSQSVPKT